MSYHTAQPQPLIIFTDEDFQRVDVNQDDLMVVRVIIVNFEVRRVLDILFVDTFNKLEISKEQINLFHNALMGFAGEQI